MYMWSVVFFMVVGGLFALLLRLELLTPKTTLITAEMYNKVFTLHGAIMTFPCHPVPATAPARLATGPCLSCSEPRTSLSRG